MGKYLRKYLPKIRQRFPLGNRLSWSPLADYILSWVSLPVAVRSCSVSSGILFCVAVNCLICLINLSRRWIDCLTPLRFRCVRSSGRNCSSRLRQGEIACGACPGRAMGLPLLCSRQNWKRSFPLSRIACVWPFPCWIGKPWEFNACSQISIWGMGKICCFLIRSALACTLDRLPCNTWIPFSFCGMGTGWLIVGFCFAWDTRGLETCLFGDNG